MYNEKKERFCISAYRHLQRRLARSPKGQCHCVYDILYKLRVLR